MVIEIDGSAFSGSGTIVRYAVVLATLARKAIRVRNIRSRRPNPGLRPQHLSVVRACCELSGGTIQGDRVGSKEILFWPGGKIQGGSFSWDIGTGGSATMMAFSLIPIGLFADKPLEVEITGGLFQDNAPGAFHMERILIPSIERMGARVDFEIRRPGYVPKGGGIIRLVVHPIDQPLKPLDLTSRGSVESVLGIALASHLRQRGVTQRIAHRCTELLGSMGMRPEFSLWDDESAIQPGAAVLLWVQTTTGCLLGADRAGKPGRRSEDMAEYVVRALVEDLETGATVDRHLADQLVLFCALASGETSYLVPQITDHLETNLWLTSTVLGTSYRLEGKKVLVEGVGLRLRR